MKVKRIKSFRQLEKWQLYFGPIVLLLFSINGFTATNTNTNIKGKRVNTLVKKAPPASTHSMANLSAGKSQMMRRAPASDPNAPIEVRGQSRNLNMLLILQNQNEAIDFIKMRKDYKNETQRMSY